MKKAKFMLAAVALFAVIGGALAFKAKSSHFLLTGPKGACNIELTGATTASGGAAIIETYFTTEGGNENCQTSATIYTTLDS